MGDSRQLVKRRFRLAECFTANERTEYVEFPVCQVRVCLGRLLVFGGDPIKSNWLIAESKLGWRSCR